MPQIADRKSMARYICVDKGATHPALQREELPKHMAIYADYGVTGTDLRQRPELNRLLTDCRAGRVNCIVAQSTTHLARRTADLLTILQELQSLGITTDFEKERFSTNSPTGKKILDTLRAMSASIYENSHATSPSYPANPATTEASARGGLCPRQQRFRGSAKLAGRAGGLLHPLDTGKPQLGVRWNLH